MQNPLAADGDPPILLTESPKPLAPQRQDSTVSAAGSSTDSNPIHPALRPDVTNVPVTPGIHLSTYQQGRGSLNRNPSNYFASNLNTLVEGMPDSAADSPSAALAGAGSGHEVLRRMSLPTDRRDSVASVDPLAANPELALSGSVISATFCLPHSMKYRKGTDWVSDIWPIFIAY